MTDMELLSAAIDASEMSARRFAIEVLGVDDRSVRKWLAGRSLPGTVRIICQAIVTRPEIVAELVTAHESIVGALPV
jgi:DNA-binding transcriptional regulator YiaG